MAVGKNIIGKKGEGKLYHLTYNIEAVRKNIKWGRGEGNENQDFINIGMGKNIKFIHPWLDNAEVSALVAVPSFLLTPRAIVWASSRDGKSSARNSSENS